jgi:hypothetical protein
VPKGRDLYVLLIDDRQHRAVLNPSINRSYPLRDASLSYRLRVEVGSEIEVGLVAVEERITNGAADEIELRWGERSDQGLQRLLQRKFP